MKRLLVIACAIAAVSPSVVGQVAGYPDFEIVESVPVETALGNTALRSTREVWLAMIGAARSSLDIEEFYISDKAGEPLEDVIAAVTAAAGRGVQIRLLVDARMYKTYPETFDRLAQMKNIAGRVIDYGKIAGGVQHAKFFIVDSLEVFLGSQNFDWRALKHIHELGVRIRYGPAAAVYRDIFDLDWELASSNDKAGRYAFLKKRSYPVPFRLAESAGDTVTFSPTLSPEGLITDTALWDETALVRLIRGARREVVLQFLSYSPVGRDRTFFEPLDNALRSAAVRGVNVKLIVSDWDKEHPAIEHLKSLAVIPNIQVKFSSIPDWSGGYVSYARVEHCKYVVADSSAFWLGTSNAEKSYFTTTRNVGVLAMNSRLARTLRDVFSKSWEAPSAELINAATEYSPREHGEKKP